MFRRALSILILLFGTTVAALAGSVSGSQPEVLLSPGDHGAELPEPWRLLEFPRRAATHYAAGPASGRTAIAALAEDAAAGVFRRVDLPVDAGLSLAWEWLIERPLPGPDRDLEADDYAARIFVVFTDERWPAAREIRLRDVSELPVLCYVWAPDGVAAESIYPSPYRDNVRTVVVRTGSSAAGSWQRERRSLAADFRRAFGRAPGRVVGLGLMTDSDDTGETARAWYGEIRAIGS